MDKVIISDKIYISNPTKNELDNITNALTYKIPKPFNPNATLYRYVPFEVIKNYKIISNSVISIPQTRTDLITEGTEIIDKRSSIPVEFPDPIYPLYDNQQIVYDRVEGNAIINAAPGWGKTFTALYLAHKLKQKTLVIVHTLFLRDQWIGSIKSLFKESCGVISSGKIDHDSFITISNIQTLKKYATSLNKSFGLVIVDECHHVPSSTFTETLSKFHSKYKIGLSGTLQRKDGKQVLFKDAFGDNVIKTQGNVMVPSVKLLNTKFSTDGNLGWADRISELLTNSKYKEFIANLAKAHVDMGYCVLILSDRTEFVDAMPILLGNKCVSITGKTKDREIIVNKTLLGEIDCISASTRIFSEGISINRLSAVILANPINNDSLLEQIIGRIQRFHENKLDPLVIDIQLSGYADAKQNNSRRGFYMRKGWRTEDIKI